MADFTAVDGDRGVAIHGALLTTAIHIAINTATAIDGNHSFAGTSHGDPVWTCDIHIALGTAEHVTRTGVNQFAIFEHGPLAYGLKCFRSNGEFFFRTDGTTTDGDGSLTGIVIELGVVAPPTDAGHFAAAEHSAKDTWIIRDADGGVGHTTGLNVLIILDVALAATEDIACGSIAGQQVRIDIGTDLTAADGDGRIAMVIALE